MARKTDEKTVNYVQIKATDEIKEMVRPAIAARRAWLEHYATNPSREGRTQEQHLELWKPFHSRLTQIGREYADALNAHRNDVRLWALESPEMRGGADAVFFMVDGVRINFTRSHQDCYSIQLFGKIA